MARKHGGVARQLRERLQAVIDRVDVTAGKIGAPAALEEQRVAGDETAVVDRMNRYRDAGVTDLAVRIVPLGKDIGERAASRRRTLQFLSSLCPAL